jgi:hypothetical protein
VGIFYVKHAIIFQEPIPETVYLVYTVFHAEVVHWKANVQDTHMAMVLVENNAQNV